MDRYVNEIQHQIGAELETSEEQRLYYKRQFPTITVKWNALEEKAIDILGSAHKLTEKRIDYDPVILMEHIAELSGVESTVNYLFSQVLSFIDIYSVIFKAQKQPTLSENDRTLYLDVRTVAQLSLMRDLKAVKEVVRNRIITCQSLLKYIKDSE